MCTVSWLGTELGYELFFSRDEARTRPAGEAPTPLAAGGVQALAPRDPLGGGSWIAVNEWGTCVALLNARGEAPPAERRSRGQLVLDLAGARDGEALGEALEGADLASFDGFRIVCVEHVPDAPDPRATRARAWRWGEGRLVEEPAQLLLASSSLGSERAREERAAVLARELERGDDPASTLERVHRSHAPERGPWSPCVHREDVTTVSLVRVTVSGERVRMHYAPGSPCESRFGPSLSLARRLAPAGGQGRA